MRGRMWYPTGRLGTGVRKQEAISEASHLRDNDFRVANDWK